MDMLTIRRLPVLGLSGAKQDYRTRISAPLLQFVQDAVQKHYPGLRVGKRFALEYVLQSYLFEKGLLRNVSEPPSLTPPNEVE